MGVLAVAPCLSGQSPNAQAIVARSVAAENADWRAQPGFNFIQTERDNGGAAITYQVTMILGSRYSRRIAVDGRPLSPTEQAAENRKFREEVARRERETPAVRARRIAAYRKNRDQEHVMLQQMAVAFDFRLAGSGTLDGHAVWVLDATPRRGYRPPNQRAKVLTGMRGRLWVEKGGYHWVKVEAEVATPVTFAGILARVQPGTRFELAKIQVTKGVWEPARFAMRAKATILGLIHHRSEEEDEFRDYGPIARSSGLTGASPGWVAGTPP